MKYLDEDGLYETFYFLIVQIVIQESINKSLLERIERLEQHSIQDSLEETETNENQNEL